jgi:DNA repair protein RadC
MSEPGPYGGYAVEIVRKGSPAARVTVASSEDVVSLVGEELRGKDREHLLCLHLDARSQVLGVETVGIGTVDTTIAHPREVFKGAIVAGASSIVLVHNHPSDVPTPGPADLEVTRQLAEAGRLLGIPVRDHVVVGGEDYVSMADEGLVDF